MYRYRTGVAWRDLPARFGPWQTVWKRHARFSRDGTWDRILTTLQARADARGDVDWRSRGGLSTKVHAAVDGRGRPLAVLVSPGQGGDAPMCVPLLNAIRVPRIGAGRPRTTPEAVLGDKAHSSRAIGTELRRRGIVSVIPEPRDQQAHRKRRGPKGGRPVSYDVEVYKGRNVVERFLNYLKQWRGLATRYDKYAHIYRGGVTLGAILCWLSSQR